VVGNDGTFPLLDALPDRERTAIIQIGRRERYNAGAYLYHAGQPGDTLHLVVKGRLAAFTASTTGEALMLSLFGPGDVFGELALFSESHTRTATIQALDPAETIALQRRDFDDLRRRSPIVTEMLLSVLVLRIERLTLQLGEMYELDAPTRVYRQLVRLGELFEANHPDGDIRMSQSHIASIAGVKLRLANRVLNEARAAGIVSLGKRRVTVHDWSRVRARAGLRARPEHRTPLGRPNGQHRASITLGPGRQPMEEHNR
jgi:CRP/FNR family transcriptional regulator, cyclic AMP receptor protein